VTSQIVIVGAGPAGALLAYLLSSRGIDTQLIERQSDFAREFRGEVLMPSGIRALEEAGIDLGSIPTVQPRSIEGYLGGRCFLAATTADIEGQTPLAVSQPALLEHLVERAERTGHFELLRGTAVRGLDHEPTGISLRIKTQGDDHERRLSPAYVVGADGRASILRQRLAPRVRVRSTPLDIVWFKLPLPTTWREPRFRFEMGGGHLLISLQGADGKLQLAWVILKGTYGELRARGIDEWVSAMASHADPELAEHIARHGQSIERPFLLDAVTDRVFGWASPNALLIGDAAHTMSPVGAQGLNLALRDAIVAANHLAPALRRGLDPNLVADRVEAERGSEIDRVQRIAAWPPRIVMGRTFVHTALRHMVARLAGIDALRRRAAAGPGVATFLHGSANVRLQI
jgi:2-polyprenyl-6-methoxyphenol hydroxylase-like FAD-dependent oxidoreductase